MLRPSKVWVLGLSTPPERYNGYCLLNAFSKYGIQTEFIDLNKLSLIEDESAKEFIEFRYNDLAVLLPDLCLFADPILCLPRSDNMWFSYTKKKLDTLSLHGVFFLNDYLMHLDTGNKVITHQKLESAIVATPKTKMLVCSTSSEEVEELVQELGGYPVVLKEPASSMGRGVYLCNNLEEIQNKLIGLADKLKECPLLVQELVDMSGLLICARVVGDEIFPRFTLGSPYVNDEFMSNLRSNRNYVACKVKPDLYDICMKAVKATGLDTARLDIFVNDNGYSVCEVNSTGSILGGEMAWNVDIADKIVKLALSKYGYSL